MKKDFIILAAIILIIVILAGGIKIQSVEDYFQSHIDDIKEDSDIIYFSIICTDALNGRLDANLPPDGIFAARKAYVLRKGDSIIDLLRRIAKYHKLPVDSAGSPTGEYVKGIGQLYEFDFGALSGWVYTVNDERIQSAADRYFPVHGDEIVWQYTRNG